MCMHIRAHPLLDKHSGALSPRLHKDLRSPKCGGRGFESNRKKSTRLSSDLKCICFNGHFWERRALWLEVGAQWANPPTRIGEGFGATTRGSEPHQTPENSSVLQICSPLHLPKQAA